MEADRGWRIVATASGCLVSAAAIVVWLIGLSAPTYADEPPAAAGPSNPPFVRKVEIRDTSARGITIGADLDTAALVGIASQRLTEELKKQKLLDGFPWGNVRFQDLVAVVDGIDVSAGPDPQSIEVRVRGHVDAERMKFSLVRRTWQPDGRKTIADVTVTGMVHVRPSQDPRLSGRPITVALSSSSVRISFQLRPARAVIDAPFPVRWREDDIGLGDALSKIPLLGSMVLADLRVMAVTPATIDVEATIAKAVAK
jgi:hypothetical protein